MNLHQRLVHECLSVIHTRSLTLTPPTIEITDAESFWGQWSSESSTIKISKKLLNLNRWDLIVGVLRHELAHQFAYQILKADETAHGEAFQIACERVGVPFKFRKSSIDLQKTSLENDLINPVKNKIDKLLNLAKSNNIYEAQLALKKAQELNAQIYLQDFQSTKIEYDNLILKSGSKKVPIEEKMILDILNKHFFVFSMIGIGFDTLKETNYRTLEIWGRTENLLMAEYVFHFLIEQINSHSKLSNDKKSFQRGLLDGFREQLDLQKNTCSEHSSLSKALVVFENDTNLKKYLKQIYPRLSKSSSKSSFIDPQSFESGRVVGKNLRISKPLKKSKPQFLGFLISSSSRST